MKIGLLLAVIASLCWRGVGIAAEVDNITPLDLQLPDTLSELNAIFNERIHEGVDRANADRTLVGDIVDIDIITQRKDCDEDRLYNELRKALFQSFTASLGLKGYALDLQLREHLSDKSYALPLRDSIYRDIDYLEGFSLKLKELSDVVNVDGHLIGLDKIGHFFAEGWQYFDKANDSDGGLEGALPWGSEKEAGLFGYTTTGIYSYADLVANFEGWRFWNKVLLKQDDPLKGPLDRLFDRAYVSCDVQLLASIREWRLVRAWEANARFDLSDYISAAWNEAVNCNSYANPVIEAKIRARIDDARPGFTCPADPGACVQARQHYGRYARQLLHPYCLIAQ